jgi:hypothetical protein
MSQHLANEMGARNRVERRRPQTTTIDGYNVNVASTGARLTAASECFGTTGKAKIPASVWWLPKLQYVRQALVLYGWACPYGNTKPILTAFARRVLVSLPPRAIFRLLFSV